MKNIVVLFLFTLFVFGFFLGHRSLEARVQKEKDMVLRTVQEFSLVPQRENPGLATDIQVSDLNHDGVDDVVLTELRVPKELPSAMSGTASIEHDNWKPSDFTYIGADNIIVYLSTPEKKYTVLSLPIPENLGNAGEITLQDINGDGETDILVGMLGSIMPSIEKIGGVLVYEHIKKTDGSDAFVPHVIEQKTFRVPKIYSKDLNRDGRVDILVAAFGAEKGDIHWLENIGNWQFTPHSLTTIDGALGIKDISDVFPNTLAVLVSQDYEKVIAYDFTDPVSPKGRTLYQEKNIDFGSNKLEQEDINGDGKKDLVWVHGDHFEEHIEDKPTDGIHWLNIASQKPEFTSVGLLPMVFNGIPYDIDSDGKPDIIATHIMKNRYDKASVGWYKNMGMGKFGAFIPVSFTSKAVLAAGIGKLLPSQKPTVVYQDMTTLEFHTVTVGR